MPTSTPTPTAAVTAFPYQLRYCTASTAFGEEEEEAEEEEAEEGLDDLSQLPFEEMRALVTTSAVFDLDPEVVDGGSPSSPPSSSTSHLRQHLPLTVVEAASFVSCEQAVALPAQSLAEASDAALAFLCSSSLVEEEAQESGQALLQHAPMMMATAAATCAEVLSSTESGAAAHMGVACCVEGDYECPESLEDLAAAAATARVRGESFSGDGDDLDDYYHLGRQSVAVEETAALCYEEGLDLEQQEEAATAAAAASCCRLEEPPRCCSVTVEQQEAFVAELMEDRPALQTATMTGEGDEGGFSGGGEGGREAVPTPMMVKLATVTSLPAVFESGKEEEEGMMMSTIMLSPLEEMASVAVTREEEEEEEARLMVVDVKTSVARW